MTEVKNYLETDLVLVKVENLKRSYGDTVVLDGVNLEIRNIRRTDNESIRQGQIVSILGPSGVGKTTLFNAIAGLQSFNDGVVLIDNPNTPPLETNTTNDLIQTKKGMVGVVYQDYRVFPFLTVEKLLKMVGANLSGDRKKDFLCKVENYLELFGLTNERKKLPKELSGGQRQRVAIAQQLLRSPQLLLMDEPFSGLDPETKMNLVETISTVSGMDEYLTMILISHDIKTSLMVSDTIYMMGKNRDENEKLTQGASILHEYTLDLKQKGLAWSHGDVEKLKQLVEIELQINQMFAYLSGK